MAKLTPPAPDELELSLFGPGIGECVVVHLGSGEWAVIDSCLNSTRARAIALDYLEQLHVDVGRQLKLIIVTHWHDDHIRGVAQLLESATSAEFVCSGALDCEEFMQLVAAGGYTKLVDDTSGISEFGRVFDILDKRQGGRFRIGPHHWACEGLRLYHRAAPRIEVYARSPSAQTITDSKGELATHLPKVGEPIRRFHSSGPNDRSVVLLVISEGVSLLLGGDLEEGKDDRRGWRAVVASAVRYSTKGDAYKVAHHGSSNADYDRIWSELLATSPIAMLTPYARGSKPLPSQQDIRRIKNRAGGLCCTVWPATQAPPRRHKAVDRTMNEIARNRRAIHRAPGQIRLRVPLNGSSRSAFVELFDGATWL